MFFRFFSACKLFHVSVMIWVLMVFSLLQCSHFFEYSEWMVMDKDSLPHSWMEFPIKTANKGAASQVAQPIVAKEMKRKPEPFVETDEEDDQPLSLRKAWASTVAKPVARSSSSSLTADAAVAGAGVTGSGELHPFRDISFFISGCF